MKNWYKKAKMIDVGEGNTISYAHCPNCKKWATEENGQIIWKPFFEMSMQEQREMNYNRTNFNIGKSKPSPHLCPECSKLS